MLGCSNAAAAWASRVNLRDVSQLRRQKLEGDSPSELYILGLIYDTHSTSTQFLDDVVSSCNSAAFL